MLLVISNDMLPISMAVTTGTPGDLVSIFSTTGIDSVGDVKRKWEVRLIMRLRQSSASIKSRKDLGIATFMILRFFMMVSLKAVIRSSLTPAI